MSNIQKNDVLDKISQVIEEAKQIKKKSQTPDIYDQAIDVLDDMKNVIKKDHALSREEIKSISDSAGIFSAKEMSIYDEKFSFRISEATYLFDYYYDLIDPDIERLKS